MKKQADAPTANTFIEWLTGKRVWCKPWKYANPEDDPNRKVTLHINTQNNMNTLKDINTKTPEGKMLMAALSSLTVSPDIYINGANLNGCRVEPDMMIRLLTPVADKMYAECGGLDGQRAPEDSIHNDGCAMQSNGAACSPTISQVEKDRDVTAKEITHALMRFNAKYPHLRFRVNVTSREEYIDMCRPMQLVDVTTSIDLTLPDSRC